MEPDIPSAANKGGTPGERARPPGRAPGTALPPSLKMARAEGAGRCRAAMAASRLELNLVRLLCRCEALAAEKRDPDEWRLEKVRGAAWSRPRT